MPRLKPLPPETSPQLKAHFDFFLSTLGFTPNSVLTMQRKPKLVKAFAELNAAVMDPGGEVDLGFLRLIGHVASKAAGCLYCQAHTLLGAHNFGVTDEKLTAVWNYQTSPLYSEKERAALAFALAAASQPNAVTDDVFARMRLHWSENQIVEILGVVAMFGFLNRWNDSLATPLEAIPLAVARAAAPQGDWSPGKHGHR
ncbi:carboxymuconolactone decarboxylase family protein [Ramlibacter sp. PS3R-8]|uniref:carboxymuconolactone decarboxylase family protein n=1 Tax=Ramlibacter sp. PS3R-8 TaxID=3133437 RepID=UPI0030B690B3